jgi:hypothetical protein
MFAMQVRSGEHHLLAVAEAALALDLEDGRDRHAEPLLELRIGVDESLAEASRKLAAERRLARARQAHQKQIAPVKRHRGNDLDGGGVAAAGGVAHRTDVTVSLMMRGVRKIRSSAFSLLLPVCLKR